MKACMVNHSEDTVCAISWTAMVKPADGSQYVRCG